MRKGKRRKQARVFATLIMLLVAAWATAAHTVPEYVLFRDRLALDILKFDSKLKLEPIELTASDGLKLRSYYFAPQPGKPLIVYFPDRLGDIIYKPRHLTAIAEEGYGLLLTGYRGYGGNPGLPSETMLYADASAMMERIAVDDLAPSGVIIYGYSMGTGVASYVAARAETLGLVLEAPFTTFGDAVRQQFSQVPEWLVRTKFDTRSRIGNVDAPILILAGGKDQITPARFAERLASINADHASLVVVPDGNHLNLIRKGGAAAVQGFLARLGAPLADTQTDMAYGDAPHVMPASSVH
ncbi:alpha/beta hydrolase [Aliihoeflea sp. 40Bstr573]|uniref:alpha/beta hydrolase n=1 Tax=Aliihoeflea sp. 40Bstr573 TaxID=2696467 RepID=UPI002096382B|nr:alpha/beta hydrolase [Aliihoeflea sp. 40Bstr573]MCO6386045.1 alpha/beta fold hydrolase [Aliihoeflea sp. 40Bstr573]